MPELQGADIEIVERRSADPSGVGVLMPTEVRINGASVGIPAGASIKIHDISEDELVTVTLTFFARSLSIHAEPA